MHLLRKKKVSASRLPLSVAARHGKLTKTDFLDNLSMTAFKYSRYTDGLRCCRGAA